MGKLWDKGYELNKVVERFTVGDDYQLDMELVRWDCVGSIAHAAMLAKIGVLKRDEYERLQKRLAEIVALHARGEFSDLPEEEDQTDELLDPSALLAVLEALAKITGGIAVDPQSGTILSSEE